MKTKKTVTILELVFAFLIMLPVIRADEFDQATKFTFNQPVEIPGQVLPAGTYWFTVIGGFDLNVVQIYNSDRSKVVASVQTNTSEIPMSTGDPVVTLAQRPSEQREALVSWSYPGRTIGHQFIYSKQEQRELAQDKQQTIVAQSKASGNHTSGGD
jgi:hypothetical protein